MRPSKHSTRKNNVAHKSGLKIMSILKNSTRESTSPSVSQVVPNTSWDEDFVLRLSEEFDNCPDKSITPETNRRQKLVRFNESTISEKWRESEERTSSKNRASHSTVSSGNSPRVNKCMTAMVVLEKLSELSQNRCIQPQKGLNTRRKINSDDDFSMRIKRYCIKCTKITINASSKDDEPCRVCKTSSVSLR